QALPDLPSDPAVDPRPLPRVRTTVDLQVLQDLDWHVELMAEDPELLVALVLHPPHRLYTFEEEFDLLKLLAGGGLHDLSHALLLSVVPRSATHASAAARCDLPIPPARCPGSSAPG